MAEFPEYGGDQEMVAERASKEVTLMSCGGSGGSVLVICTGIIMMSHERDRHQWERHVKKKEKYETRVPSRDKIRTDWTNGSSQTKHEEGGRDKMKTEVQLVKQRKGPLHHRQEMPESTKTKHTYPAWWVEGWFHLLHKHLRHDR